MILNHKGSTSVGSDHYFHTCSIKFQIPAKQNNFQVKIVTVTGRNEGLAEWIIDGEHVLLIHEAEHSSGR